MVEWKTLGSLQNATFQKYGRGGQGRIPEWAEQALRAPPLQLQAESQGKASSDVDLLHIQGEISSEP